MGSKASHVLEEELLEEFTQLTYLNRSEIIHMWNCFYAMDPDQVKRDNHCYLPVVFLEELLPQLTVNPFQDRLYEIFFPNRDGNGGVYFSFEQMLDMCSALSPKCPDKVKAQWVFKIFDFNKDNLISEEDLAMSLDRLTNGKTLSIDEKKHIINSIMKEVDLGKTGSISSREFVHVVMKMPDFASSFQLKV
ncbi:Calcium and integrin-binding protein 1 [Blattella germanica]|nr:Calcium and integrin-binding protein 1 [Blattella germanica]